MNFDIDKIKKDDLKLSYNSGLTKRQEDRLVNRHMRFMRWKEISLKLAIQMFGLPSKW